MAMKSAARVLAVVLLVAVVLPVVAAACPLCKEAASNADQPGQSGMWRGMYWSILLMVAMPFMMVGGMIVAVRRARRRQESALPGPRPPLPFPETGARP
jgi:heme/copper-type cytochrome/quinol oxidase subunit 2